MRNPLKIHSGGELAYNEASSQSSRSAATLRLSHFIAAHFTRQNEFLEGFLRIKFLFFIMTIILISPAQAEDKKTEQKPVWDKVWASCRSDDDCVAMQGACGNWVGVSMLGRASAYDFLLNESLSAKCKEYKMFPAPKIICQKAVGAEDGQCISEREAKTTNKED